MRQPLRRLAWPTAIALGLHGALGWSVLSRLSSAEPSNATVLAISLAPSRSVLLTPAQAASVLSVPSAPTEARAEWPRDSVAQLPQSYAPERSSAANATSASNANDAEAGQQSEQSSARTEHFYLAKELTRLPGLEGEPIIDLGDDSQAITGSMALRLLIDETGRIVEHHIEADSTLPAETAEKLERAFSGYRYRPAELRGQPVKSEVTLILSVRDGQAALGVPP